MATPINICIPGVYPEKSGPPTSFWTQPWPVGIHRIPRHQLINADKFGLHLNAENRRYGSAPIGLKICKPGNYDCGTFKLTIILAVETGNPDIPDEDISSVLNSRIRAWITTEPGT